MSRQRAAQRRPSPRSIQQGVSIVLAFVITLIGGQQFLLWQHSQQADATIAPAQHLAQAHFSAVSSRPADGAPARMMDVGQAEPGYEVSRQERWVF
ncbi:hypothetical protein SAMN04487857_103409 [Pseudomonas sp. ok272]|uniref:hypothetical protein n=1 Tax=unclassified Pseudomonas TaxID=196821 RepID=UPI0008D0CBCA|nr:MULTISPECIES: hypothetical protein [unclassified Pseudomonas]SEM64758.1 hypothetical protein SAMN04487857_103409 [Pseudomonas sp. ok272]SFM44812.1 hypothetical protein SAMN04487858_10326 [Pseudomonas sp. ok602]